mmetsp:Transcript_26036/g.44241  ORF Transcript_26036/g.44241 Transcript_26036/m.44241 type:complete len:734 (-) Transcript_26036:114-2315(-)
MIHSRHYRSVRRLVNRSIAQRKATPSPCRCASSTTNISGGSGDMTIYNSLSSTYQKLNPPPPDNTHTTTTIESNPPPTLGTAWYVCGPTVYDSAHLGHGRTYVSLDILRRVALSLHDGSSTTQPRPIYAMNITDVDDKIIQRSMEINDNNSTSSNKASLSNPLALARYYEMEFWQDMDSLNVLRPDVVCRVSEHVEQTIVPYIEMILQGGMAYVIPEDGDDDSAQKRGSVYFDVRAFEHVTEGRTKYGKLAPDVASSDFFSWDDESNDNNASTSDDDSNNNNEGESPSQLRQKRDSRDFCLWKYRTQSPPSPSSNLATNNTPMIEPAIVSYSSPWGPGRPGWHVECSAMIQRLSMDFQSTHKFQLHAGGIDLKFPHHSNEIAQAEAFHEAVTIKDDDGEGRRQFEEWIPNWVHTGHLYVKGRKMSKSLKNFVTIREMLGISTNTNDKGGVETTDSHQNQSSAWSCPSDDFRLWCLGLSGSYRGPATYSKDRMDEARVIRTKWVKFLMEGQQCLDEWKTAENNCHDYYATDDSASQQSTKVWGEDELQLFNQVTQSGMKCREALVGRCTTNTDGSTRGSFDLDGASFVKELTKLADLGLAYVQAASIHKPRPGEPLRFAVETFRRQLDLVGFTSYTINAGISTTLEHASSSNADLLDEIAAFRSAIRSATLNGIRSKDTMAAAKEVLGLCDELRDDVLPSLGVELVDGKVTNGVGDNRAWRRCSPRDKIPKEDE